MDILPSEVGPIRPPSESHSLLIRISRNCPWNRCLFCPVYKDESFSLRKIDQLLSEIKHLSEIKSRLLYLLEKESFLTISKKLENYFNPNEYNDAHRILHWLYHREYTVFLQDADPLFRRKDEIFSLLNFIKSCFPETTRITAYARASTIAKFSSEELTKLRLLGLSRIHTGLESGSKNVLSLVKKGVKQEDFIEAGNNLSKANIEFSLYVMPGLGGKKFSTEHILETADVINYSRPTFLRFRTLALNSLIPLYQLYKNGEFELLSEEEMVLEIKEIIENIRIKTTIFSDHNLNLLMEVRGTLPKDRVTIDRIFSTFFSLPNDLRLKFIISRRLNLVFELNEFLSFSLGKEIEDIYENLITVSDSEREEWFLKMRSNNL